MSCPYDRNPQADRARRFLERQAADLALHSPKDKSISESIRPAGAVFLISTESTTNGLCFDTRPAADSRRGEIYPPREFLPWGDGLDRGGEVNYHRVNSRFEPLSNPRRKKNGYEKTVKGLEESEEDAAPRQGPQEDANPKSRRRRQPDGELPRRDETDARTASARAGRCSCAARREATGGPAPASQASHQRAPLLPRSTLWHTGPRCRRPRQTPGAGARPAVHRA